MEMNIFKNIYKWMRHLGMFIVAILLLQAVDAQQVKNGITVGEGKVYLTMHRNITDIELKAIVEHYGLDSLPLRAWVRGEALDKMKKYGWKLDKEGKEWMVFSHPLEGLGDFSKLEKKLLLAGEHLPGADLYPLGVFNQDFGFNQLRQASAVVVISGKTTLFAEGYKSAGEVKIAGSFTNWGSGALPMKQSAEGWYITLNLPPGKYYYKFIADGEWLLHKENRLKENDGRGNTNSVLFVPNHTFRLGGFENAKVVKVSGSFNAWNPGDAGMRKTNSGWELPVYLPEGTHTYRFVVDGRWISDPGNSDKLRNEFGEFNSVVRLGKSYIFRLDGFENAKDVTLVGSFNHWRSNELKLERKAGGWEIPFTLGHGNHEYFYEVDGQRIGRKPENEKAVKDNRPLNFHTIIGGNYSFKLNGYKNASAVYISGSFNNWSETGFPLVYENGLWVCKVYLPPGKQTYKFIVDGKWILDPANPLWEQNEHGTRNSVLWFENS
jgi:hypothetical protein